MKPLKQQTNAELLSKKNIGVHTAAEMIRRGIAERCDKKDADWIVIRTGIYSSYGIKGKSQ